jgi:hypothetical protein
MDFIYDFFDDAGPVTWTVIVVLALAVAAGIYFFIRWRNPKEEMAYYFRCPNCKMKLKYFARQVGHKGMCRACRERIVFPTPVIVHR